MAKLFLIPRQKVEITTRWTQFCPKCNSIEELTETKEYDVTVSKIEFQNEIATSFNYSNERLISETRNTVCKNCGYVFE
jgi:hypothetical protein